MFGAGTFDSSDVCGRFITRLFSDLRLLQGHRATFEYVAYFLVMAYAGFLFHGNDSPRVQNSFCLQSHDPLYRFVPRCFVRDGKWNPGFFFDSGRASAHPFYHRL